MVFQIVPYFVLFLALNAAAKDNPKPGFILTTSPTIILGSSHKACVTLHHVTGKAHVHLSLNRKSPEKEQIAETTVELDADATKPGKVSCMNLEIPKKLDGFDDQSVLNLKISFDSLPDYKVDESRDVTISRWVHQHITFIESDLQVYKPNDVVRIRILTLKTNNFKPILEPIAKVSVENPSGIRVAQWLNVTTDTGLGQIDFPLSSEPKTGVWRIIVDRYGEDSQSEDTFEVREYVLPRFKVVIDGPKELLDDNKTASYKICGKYSYGKPVQGKVQVATDIYAKYSYEPDEEKSTISEWKATDKSGCVHHIIESFKEFLSKVVVRGSFKEEGTEKTENFTLETKVQDRSSYVMFELVSIEEFAKPGMIYTKQIKAYRGDDNVPAPNVCIEVCLEQCKNYTSDANGLVTVQYVLEEGVSSIGLLEDITENVMLKVQPTNKDLGGYSSLYLKSWHSPSGSYMNILHPTAEEDQLQCGKTYPFTIEYQTSSNVPKEFYYIIQSRSDIVNQSTIKNSVGNDIQYNSYNLSNVLLSSNSTNTTTIKVPKLNLELEITPNMAPKSSLLVYYVTDDGETVSASLTMEVEKCFNNAVDQTWSETKPYPGQSVKMHLSTSPNSLCAISSVDESTKYLQLSVGNKHESGTRVTTDWVYSSLQMTGVVGRIANNGDQEYCTKKHGEPPSTEQDNYYTSILHYNVDALQAFNNAGLLVLSNYEIETHQCYVQKNPVYEIEENILYDSDRIGGGNFMALGGGAPTETVRDNFPDSWLWELVHVGADGKLDVPRVLPDTITNWETSTYCISPDLGLGVTSNPTSQLTAFQPFFVEFSPPYSVKRGEIIHLNIQVFNYMPHSLPVSVELQSEDGLKVTMKDGKVQSSVCIGSEEAAIIPISITAQRLGKLNVTITAIIDSKYPDQCGPEKLVYRSDKLIKPVFVQPEGFPVEIGKSTLMCPTDFPKDAILSWNFSLPADVVSDSARAQVSVSGDILGKALENLDQLVQLPMGCGEQNMILFVPNLHVLNYLKSAAIGKPKLQADAIKNLKIGYERELNYRHNDGSFSAFGESDSEGSTWLTAFVVKSFAQAKKFIFIDDKYLEMSKDWLINNQHENGCFKNIGQVVHKEMKGGLTNSSVGLTAFVLISLLHSDLPLEQRVVTNAKLCISRANNSDTDSYTQSLITYAHTLQDKNSSEAKKSLQQLLQQVHEDDGLFWWESEGNSLAVKIETTSYAVLSLLKHGGSENMAKALGAVRWLSKHRNPRGGFESTQDTVLALEAISLYATVISSRETDFQMIMKVDDTPTSVAFTKESSAILQTLPIDKLPSVVNIEGTGKSCAMVMGTLKYNVHNAKASDAFGIEAEMVAGPIKKIKLCAWYKLPDGASNMAVIEVDMVTGYEPDQSTLTELQKVKKVIKRFDAKSDRVVLYLDKLQKEKTCMKFEVTKTGATVENAKPAKVNVYDYYSPELRISTSYVLPSELQVLNS